MSKKITPAVSAEIQELEEIVTHLDSAYELGDPCLHPKTGQLVSDQDYDQKYRGRLQQLCKDYGVDSVVLKTPTASKVDASRKMAHDPPLTSISKASHEDPAVKEEMLFKWMADCTAGLPDGPVFDLSSKTIDGTQIPERKYLGKVVTYPRDFFYQAYKLDGVALGLYYENGKLVKAGLRPRDGVNGEDVTEQVKFVDGIPTQLKQAVTCSIRGELICKLSDFAKVQQELTAAGEKLRANPRNHAAGGIRQFKDPQKVKQMRLSFIAYAIEAIANPPYKTEIERAKWCNKDLGIQFVRTTAFNFYDLEKLEKNVPNLDYEVDGVIVGVNDLDAQYDLGRSGDPKTGNPKGKIAWKFAEETAAPTVKQIEWNTGRTGAVKPVAIFDAVPLAGTMVGRATLHNYGFMNKNRIDVGAQVEILKAGKIIPKVVGVKKPCAKAPEYPVKCPSCGQTTHLEKDNKDPDIMELMCYNKACPAQNVAGLCHYLTTFGVLGLGDARVEQLVDAGAVKKFSDFYKLSVTEAERCGMSKRQALLAVASIWMVSSPDKMDDADLEKKVTEVRKHKISIPLSKLFAAFGIETAGKSAGKALVDHFGDFGKIRAANVSSLESVSNVGTKTAEIVHDWLKDNSKEIDELLNFIEPTVATKNGKLSGLTLVLTGGFPQGKTALEKLIEDNGGRCSSSVSKTTNYVVVGTDAGSKEQKADALGIKKISADELKKML
jgi:DNA ligase (NAD+)